jgi:pimeloyl-ACP methyl ester carboxylesterase
VSTEQLTFPAGDGHCTGWLTLPEGEGPHAAVVLVHGFGATREMALPTYEQRFSAAGYAVLTFDFRHIGASPGQPRQLFHVSRILEDVAAALCFARSRPEIDARRIALWGTSFGASHVLATAARDSDVAAAVVQCPMIATVRTSLGLGLAHLARLTWPITEDLIRRALGRQPRYVTLVGSPGELALVNKPGAREGWHGLVPDGGHFENHANAAVALDFLRYRADAHAARIRCPLLVCVSDRENLMDPDIAARVAERAPRGQAIHYDADHWTIYHPPQVDQLISDQLAFLRRHMPPSGVPAAAEARRA